LTAAKPQDNRELMSTKRTPHSSATWDVKELALRLRNSAPGQLFGYELDSIGDGKAVMSLRVMDRHLQIHGVVHGGILASLADTAGAMAAYPLLPKGTRLATVEMTINYLEAVDRGPIIAEARVLRLGRTLAVAECEIKDAEGKLAAKSLLTFAILSTENAHRISRRKK
jgi:acyl-CoA thioesterase